MKKTLLLALGLLHWTACSDDLLNGDLPSAPSGEPDLAELGLRLVPPDIALDLSGLSAAQRDAVARGSYLVNGVAGCGGCHSSDAGYLAGGNEFSVRFLPADINGNETVLVRNLTPDPDTGLDLTEAEFIESMRTGKDFHDSTDDAPQRMLFMPIQAYRFILEEDLKAIYAFLQSIPPVHNELRLEYVPNFPFPPVALPLLDEGADPEGITRGLQIPHAFSSGPETDAFTDQFDTNVGNLSDGERAKVGRGAYLVNAIANCNTCHTDGVPDGAADSGLVPDTFDFNAATHLAGGVDLAGRNRLPFPVLSRNLTSHPDTGLEITEAEFVQVMRFGADFRRPGGSLRVGPHFLAGFRMTFVDLQAIYAYLRTIPAVDNEITITEPE